MSYRNLSYITTISTITAISVATATTVTVLLLFTVPINAQLVGQGIPCSEEGMQIDLADVTRGLVTSPCYHCVCKNGVITCVLEKCESLKNCPIAWDRNNSTCCMKCLHCVYLGVKRNNDEVWASSEDSCTQISCKAGLITSWRIQCLTNCTPGRYLAGFCCGLCSTPVEVQDQCVRCDLVLNQWYHCYRFTCPVLNCPISQHIKHPKRCCPECRRHTAISERSNMTVSNGTHCVFRGRRYRVHDTFRTDPCTRCTCQRGGITCRRFVCPFRECDASRLFYKLNVCCPFCHKKGIPCKRNDTNETEIEVQHGVKWTLDNCTNCVCVNGRITCRKVECPWTGKCPRGRRYRKVEGSCCHECELKEASCTVFGDPHYITFDKFGYTYQGACSYILSQECSLDGNDPRFKVIGVNGGRPPLTWTRRITVYISLFNGSFFAVHLLPKKIIRERDHAVSLPYVRYSDWPEYRAYEDPSTGHVVVSFKFIGLKVIWDGESFAEIVLTKRHQTKVCGLCGNFNGDPSDDLLPGFAASPLNQSVAQFARSWIYDTACAWYHHSERNGSSNVN